MRVLVLCVLLALLPAWGEPALARELPEFSALVEKQSPVVVNISATQVTRQARAPFMRPAPGGNVPEWLRRLLPPNAQAPQESEDDRSLGSGFIIDANGYILTNAHVVENADEIMVRLNDKREYLAHLIGTDKRSDIALLKVEASSLPVAHMGDPGRLKVGDWVLAIGSPFGFDSTVTAGIVSAKGRSLPDDSIVPFIQTDVAINPGNSGGPLFNLKGEVVGVNSQIYSRTGGFMGLSFSIPIDVAMDVQAQLRARGKVLRGRIGVLIQEVTREMSESFGLTEPGGALISAVEPGGPAALAGLKTGDIILRFDNKLIANSYELPRVVGATEPGKHSTVSYWRGGARKADLTVAQFPDEQDEASPRTQNLQRSVRGSNVLGLVTQDLSREQRKEFGLEQGAAIREATGAAARAELRPGDVVTALISRGASNEIRSPDHFNRLTAQLPPGSAVTLLVRRGDSQSFVGMKVPAR